MLDQFEQKTGIKVNLTMIDWASYRSRLVDIAIHNRGADVSAVTVPSTNDMIGMSALRPYTPNEIRDLGEATSFPETVWKSVIGRETQQIWAIPWMIDSRYIFYWPDLLEKAGIDESTAFTSSQKMVETFQKLKESGIKIPFYAPIEAYQILHAVSSWIWEAGADIISPDGSSVTFHHPTAINAIRSYFEMIRQLPPESLSPERPFYFVEKHAAFSIGGGWFLNGYENIGDQVKLADVPGGPYLGGTSLVIWKHTHYEKEAFELVKWLSQPEIQTQISFPEGFLPSRVSVVTDPELLKDPVIGPRLHGILNGRTFPCVPMIGLVEDRLSQELARIQGALIDQPKQNTGEIVRSMIEPLGRRLNIALSSDKV